MLALDGPDNAAVAFGIAAFGIAPIDPLIAFQPPTSLRSCV